MIPLKHLHVVLIYLAVIRSSFARLLPKGRKNVVTFFMYGIDKWRSTSGRLLPTGRKKAKNSKWRIRETALLGLAVLGGSIGAWIGMKVWHHKTLHKGGNRDIDNIVGGYQFKYGVPAIIISKFTILGRPVLTIVFYVNGHMFCNFNIDDFSAITVKCDPAEMEELIEIADKLSE